MHKIPRQPEFFKYIICRFLFVKQMIIRILTLMMHGLVRKKIPLKRCHLTPSVQRRIRCRPDIPHDIPPVLTLLFVQCKKTFSHITFQHIIKLSSTSSVPLGRFKMACKLIISVDAAAIVGYRSDSRSKYLVSKSFIPALPACFLFSPQQTLQELSESLIKNGSHLPYVSSHLQ